jgi:hypothetical protein
MGDAPGALGGAIPRDKTLRDCCVSFPKRTILSSASVGIKARNVTKKRVWVLGSITKPPSPHIVLFGSGSEPQDFVPGNSSSQSPRRVPHV